MYTSIWVACFIVLHYFFFFGNSLLLGIETEGVVFLEDFGPGLCKQNVFIAPTALHDLPSLTVTLVGHRSFQYAQAPSHCFWNLDKCLTIVCSRTFMINTARKKKSEEKYLLIKDSFKLRIMMWLLRVNACRHWFPRHCALYMLPCFCHGCCVLSCEMMGNGAHMCAHLKGCFLKYSRNCLFSQDFKEVYIFFDVWIKILLKYI